MFAIPFISVQTLQATWDCCGMMFAIPFITAPILLATSYLGLLWDNVCNPLYTWHPRFKLPGTWDWCGMVFAISFITVPTFWEAPYLGLVWDTVRNSFKTAPTFLGGKNCLDSVRGHLCTLRSKYHMIRTYIRTVHDGVYHM